MFEDLTLIEGLKLFAPILAIQAGLTIFCIIKIIKEGVGNLNKIIWIPIVTFGSLIGPIVFLLFGRKRDL